MSELIKFICLNMKTLKVFRYAEIRDHIRCPNLNLKAKSSQITVKNFINFP